jgi:hypothetical protein
MDYPNGANGDVLRRTEVKGDDFRPRNINYTVVFADEYSAEQLAKHFRTLGHEVSAEKTGTSKNLPYDVNVYRHVAPSYDGIRRRAAIHRRSLGRVMVIAIHPYISGQRRSGSSSLVGSLSRPLSAAP